MSRNKSLKFMTCLTILTLFIAAHPAMGSSTPLAQAAPSYIRQVRVIETGKLGIRDPVGVAFSPQAGSFYIMETRQPSQAVAPGLDIIKVTSDVHQAGIIRVPLSIRGPINVAFDSHANRLLILEPTARNLISILEKPEGDLDLATLVRYDARSFGLQNPQGMAVDPANGRLFILDAVGPRIICIEPASSGSFDGAVTSELSLGHTGLTGVRGLAMDPSSGHFYLLSSEKQALYEVTDSGQVVTTRDLSTFGLVEPQGLVYAPSGDTTDDPSEMSLYVADNGLVVEFSFIAIPAPASLDFVAHLVRTVDTSTYDPPSPDPSALAYLPLHNTLLMADAEVEEVVSGTTHFQGVNLWEITLSGSVVNTANISRLAPTVVPMTNEPAGLAWNPGNGHFYVCDDVAKRVYDLSPGLDGQYGTADDTWTSFDTLVAGSGDPEGITFDTWHNRIFVADETNMEIYEFTMTGSLVSHFDVERYGVADPESVEFNPDNGTLFVVSGVRGGLVAVETTISGTLIQTIDISAAGASNAAGLAYAPASDGSGAMRFYIADRGIDNNTDPNIIDGKIYEMTAPSSTTSDNEPPVAVRDTYSTAQNTQLTVDIPGILGNDTDANEDALSAVLVSNVTHGVLALNVDGSFTYTPTLGFIGTDSFAYKAYDGMEDSNVETADISVKQIAYLPLVANP